MPDSSQQQKKKALLFCLFQLALFCVFSLWAFGRNPARLLAGNDGPMMISLLQEQLEFFGPSTALHTNFLQGLGNLSFPINPSAQPGFWFPLFDAAGNLAAAATYTWFAAMVFLCVLLTGWTHHFPRRISYEAAWLLSILMFPYIHHFAIYPVTGSAPPFALYVVAAALANTALWRIGKESWAHSIFYTMVLACGILIMLCMSPSALLLILPFLCISGITALISAAPRERIRMMLAVAALLLLMGALGWVEYVAGLLLSADTTFFMQGMLPTYPPWRQFASILYQGRIPDRRIGSWLFMAALFGAVWVLRSRQVSLRASAWMMLAGQALLAGVAVLVIRWSGGWSGPAPVYSEMPFFPLYALFAVYFLGLLSQKISTHLPALRRGFTRLNHPYLTPLVCVMLLSGLLALRPPERDRDLAGNYALPPKSTALTDILEKEIAVHPGSDFRGRVATILPGQKREAQTPYFFKLDALTGNDHQTTGLWLKNIPTLHEYGQLTTPGFYHLTRRFLTVPDDLQNRSWTNFSRIDTKLLPLLGVRFLLTTDASVSGATKRATLPLTEIASLYLYEMDNANIAGISAQNVTILPDVTRVEDSMASATFDRHTALVMAADMQNIPSLNNLAPIRSSQIRIEKGAYRISAASVGQALLILPIEFSRCLDITPLSGARPLAFRVDSILTGLLFEGQMDVTLVQNTGPFSNPRCRLQDYKDARAVWAK